MITKSLYQISNCFLLTFLQVTVNVTIVGPLISMKTVSQSRKSHYSYIFDSSNLPTSFVHVCILMSRDQWFKIKPGNMHLSGLLIIRYTTKNDTLAVFGRNLGTLGLKFSENHNLLLPEMELTKY